jgi:hypothetical protein
MDEATISAVPYIGLLNTVRPTMSPMTRNANPKVQVAAAIIKNFDNRSLSEMIDIIFPPKAARSDFKKPAENRVDFQPASLVSVG